MTRLESSASDYAIALVAVGRLHGFLDTLKRIDLRLARDVEDAELDVCETTRQHDGIRLVRARVALYLRLLRRVEAWERHGRYTLTHWSSFTRVHPKSGPVYCVEAVHIGDSVREIRGSLSATPWRPLWTSAPPHEPGVTARMRRGRMEALGREAQGPEVVT